MKLFVQRYRYEFIRTTFANYALTDLTVLIILAATL
jgi:hypothetical protein